MASGQDSAGSMLMDLISSDPTPAASSTAAAASSAKSDNVVPSTGPASALGKPASTGRRSTRLTVMQFQSDTISAAKALNPVRTSQKTKKKPVSYAQLARSIHELAAASDQKSSQKQLVNHVFPKLAVYNSVDPSLAPSLLMLHQQCEDRNVLHYVYYYLARILSDTGAEGLTPGGGILTPNWDALADIDAVGGVTRADVVPRIVGQLTAEASNADPEYNIPMHLGGSKQMNRVDALYPKMLQTLKTSARREFLASQVVIKRIQFADPVAVRHSLAIISDLSTRDPYSVAIALA